MSIDVIAAPVGNIVPSAIDIIQAGSVVVDYGCFGWRLAEHCRSMKATLIGVDQTEPAGKPCEATFVAASKVSVEISDDCADVVIASHVLEHVGTPVELMRELLRITRPMGLIWIEAPSELSALCVASSDAEDHSFTSFWDDPTHIRPWTPGALYRLALSVGCVPVAIGRCDAGGIPAVRLLARKNSAGLASRSPRYVSLREVRPGIRNAWAHVWGGVCHTGDESQR